MEKELNIADILRDKPKGIKIYSTLIGNCIFKELVGNRYPILISAIEYSSDWHLLESGKFEKKGECIIFPSKEMRDWEKFAWKKGDVLKTDVEEPCYTIFSSFQGEYTEFSSRYYYCGGERWLDFGGISSTNHFIKASDEEAKEFIKKVEERYGGKLNLSTLEIEQPMQKFKDGDIVTFKRDDKPDITIILKRADFDYIDQLPRIHYHAMYDYQTNKLHKELGYIKKDLRYDGCLTMEGNEFILATDSEKQQLFSALAKENKAWDAKKKMLVDLPKKCELKAMDWCLMRNENSLWHLCQFAFKNTLFDAVGGNVYDECIPYNDSTKHLLGTNDEWEGGNNE